MDQGRSQAVRPMADLMARPGTEAAARLSGCENFADALPRDGGGYVPAWGVTLAGESPVPEQVRRAGIRARSFHPAQAGAVNALSCRVVRVVEDVNALTVLLRPEAAAADVLPIRMEADRETWTARAGETVTVAADPGGILPLEQQ